MVIIDKKDKKLIVIISAIIIAIFLIIVGILVFFNIFYDFDDMGYIGVEAEIDYVNNSIELDDFREHIESSPDFVIYDSSTSYKLVFSFSDKTLSKNCTLRTDDYEFQFSPTLRLWYFTDNQIIAETEEEVESLSDEQFELEKPYATKMVNLTNSMLYDFFQENYTRCKLTKMISLIIYGPEIVIGNNYSIQSIEQAIEYTSIQMESVQKQNPPQKKNRGLYFRLGLVIAFAITSGRSAYTVVNAIRFRLRYVKERPITTAHQAYRAPHAPALPFRWGSLSHRRQTLAKMPCSFLLANSQSRNWFQGWHYLA